MHWIEFGEDSGPGRDEPPIVFVHGLGGSHLNWCLIGPQLAADRRAVALDLHGFGLTPGGRYTSTVQRNARLLDRFVREVTGTPVILAGNSMGGLISILQTAAAPDTVQGLVLIDPALPLPRRAPDRQVGGQFLLYALPGLGELYVRKVMTRTPPQLAVQRVVDLCFADPSRADPAMLTASIALAAERQSQPARARDQAFLAASRSLMRVVGLRRRYWEMMASVRVPVLLIGGEADRLVPVAGMRQAAARNPRWETVILPGVGHTPQLEVPDTVTETLRDWLGRHFDPDRRLRRNGRMQQLTGLDASFLALETANTTGHVGGLSVLDPSGAPKPLTLARLTEVMAERVALVPVLRRKLLNVPLGLDQPYWIDDPRLRHRVPRPRDRAAASGIRRPADRTGQPAARPPARPQPPAVGDLPDHRAGQEARRRLHQDPSRRDRRGLRRRAADGPA